MTRPSATFVTMGLSALALAPAGCMDLVSREKLNEVTDQLVEARSREHKLADQVKVLQAESARQREQIASLLRLPPDRVSKLFTVHHVSVGSRTRGFDDDGKPGDDGVRVYVKPTDRHGSVIKAAGDVKIQLYDLAAPPERSRVGEHRFGPEQIEDHWTTGLMSQSFIFECPWTSAPPAHREITVRVEFTDYLTGSPFTAQSVCTVKLPPATQPATSPARAR